MPKKMKDYLGDSVYAEETAFGDIQLTTDNGEGASNTIIMDQYVLAAFDHFRARLNGIRALAALRDGGWTLYPKSSDDVGNFVEDLDVIQTLIGSAQYESMRHDGEWYIRRSE